MFHRLRLEVVRAVVSNSLSKTLCLNSPRGAASTSFRLDWDFVEIVDDNDGDQYHVDTQVIDKSSGESSEKLCGSELPDPITSTGNMTIVFHR